MLTAAGNFAENVDNVFILILVISLVLLVGITGLMIYFVIRYNSKRNPNPTDIHGHALLEILWTVIPTLLVLGMFYFGWINFRDMRDVPEDALEINVTAQMWAWAYHYENGASADTLYVPVNQNIKLNLHSRDVLHSYYIPAFRLKFDVVPGTDQYLWFKPDRVGRFNVLCAEYCGLQHSYMFSSIVVLSEEEYNTCYNTNAQTADMTDEDSKEDTIGNAARGAQLVRINGCLACHSTDGTKLVSNSFKGLYGKKTIVITDGQERELTASDDYIRRSIRDPASDLAKGFSNLMPPLGDKLSDEDINNIIAYLKEIK